MVFAIYNPINVDKVITGVNEEVDRLLRDGVAAAELDRAKAGFLQQRQVQRSDDMMLAAPCSRRTCTSGGPCSSRPTSSGRSSELTPDAVNAALRKYIDPKKLTVVTAGDFKKKYSG